MIGAVREPPLHACRVHNEPNFVPKCPTFREVTPLFPSLFTVTRLTNLPISSFDVISIPCVPIGMIGVANRSDPYDIDHEQLLITYAA